MKFLKFLLISVSILLFFWLAYLASDTFFEPKAYNYMVKNFTAYKHGSSDIVLVVIDDKSIGRHRWPWKRELYCGIFDYFTEYTKAKLLVHDTLLINEEDVTAQHNSSGSYAYLPESDTQISATYKIKQLTFKTNK